MSRASRHHTTCAALQPTALAMKSHTLKRAWAPSLSSFFLRSSSTLSALFFKLVHWYRIWGMAFKASRGQSWPSQGSVSVLHCGMILLQCECEVKSIIVSSQTRRFKVGSRSTVVPVSESSVNIFGSILCRSHIADGLLHLSVAQWEVHTGPDAQAHGSALTCLVFGPVVSIQMVRQMRSN